MGNDGNGLGRTRIVSIGNLTRNKKIHPLPAPIHAWVPV